MIFRYSIFRFLTLESQGLDTRVSASWHSSVKTLTFECQEMKIGMFAKHLSKGLFLSVHNQKTFNGNLTFLSSMNFALILHSFSRKIVIFHQTACNVFLWIWKKTSIRLTFFYDSVWSTEDFFCIFTICSFFSLI